MDKKAFTLVELLAVVTILGIVTVISVPTILGVITPVKNKAGSVSNKMVEEAAQKWVTENGGPESDCFVPSKYLIEQKYLTVKLNEDNVNRFVPENSGVLIKYQKVTGGAVSSDNIKYTYEFKKSKSSSDTYCPDTSS